jgi:hypothetical protein
MHRVRAVARRPLVPWTRKKMIKQKQWIDPLCMCLWNVSRYEGGVFFGTSFVTLS